MESFLQSHRIDVLSHSDFLGRRASLPAICWIGDFQHREQPQFFSRAERVYRDRDFMMQCRHASRILVSSYHAQRGLAAFAPSCVARSRVLQFVAQPHLSSETPSLSELQERYGFVGPYFHVPNQFWAHKNHQLIVDALALLKRRGQPILVISTGATEDYRRPGYFDELMAHARAVEVRDWFTPLGVISYNDLVGLMAHAVALINPSRAEGWSTSVEEAKSLGKRIILSDIPVHREQAPPAGVYVTPDDPAGLAEAMSNVWRSFDPEAERERSLRASRELPARVRAFAENYEDIVFETLGQSRRTGSVVQNASSSRAGS
jgi:glycosyltransferase involved in cell wall biosynthesis